MNKSPLVIARHTAPLSRKGGALRTIVFFAALTVLGVVLNLSACSGAPVTPQEVVTTGLAVEQLACVFAQATLGENEPQVVAKVCAIPAPLLQDVADVILAQAKAAKMVEAAKAGPKK